MNNSTISNREVRIPVAGDSTAADVTIPFDCRGLVVFAHGSGSSRFSKRSRFVAERLVAASLGTVLLISRCDPKLSCATSSVLRRTFPQTGPVGRAPRMLR
jgi:hypothetical protein